MIFPSCHETTARASDYLDGRLGRWDRFRFRLHLWICERCQRFFAQLRAVTAALRALPAPETSDGAREALVARFRGRRTPGAW